MLAGIGSKKRISASIVAVLLMASIYAPISTAQETGTELQKQEEIYRSRGSQVPKGYITNRGLTHYDELLPRSFPSLREALGSRGRWLDIGAGNGQAIVDFALRTHHVSTEKQIGAAPPDALGRLVALSIEDRRLDAWHRAAESLRSNEIRYIHGRRLRDFTVAELGRFGMITDVYGGFSYTDDLSQFMEKVLSFLDMGGSFFTLIQSVRLADGKERPQTWFLTEISDAGGRDVTPCAWLRRIACAQVTCDSKSQWDPATELIEVRKICEATSVPKLVRISYEAGTPPERKFMLFAE